MRAIVRAPKGPYELEPTEQPAAAPGMVVVKVTACGFCHSDENIRNGWTGNDFPRVPGHEVVGYIVDVGRDVPALFDRGVRVGIGWHGGNCGTCDACRKGDVLQCPDKLGCGTSYDGGFQSFVHVPWSALVRIPSGLSDEEAAPLLCAGITVWNGLRRSGASWGDTVAIQGIGGLGHLAVQFARAMGFHTVALTSSADKMDFAKELGAHECIVGSPDVQAQQLQEMGGAKAILVTGPSATSVADWFEGLGWQGRVVIVGVGSEPIAIPGYGFLGRERGIHGSVVGTPLEMEAMLQFCARMSVKPHLERYRLDQIQEVQERLHANRIRFRAVLVP